MELKHLVRSRRVRKSLWSKKLESAGWIGDWLQHGRVRHADSGLHACRHLSGLRFDKHTSRLPCDVDDAWCCCGRAHFRNHERPLWSNQGTDVDHCCVLRVHRPLWIGMRLLGLGGLPDIREPRPGRRVRHHEWRLPPRPGRPASTAVFRPMLDSVGEREFFWPRSSPQYCCR